MTGAILEWLKMVRDAYIPRPGRVLEVGSQDLNGSPRTSFAPGAESYTGVDASPGRGVDVVLSGELLVQRFGEASFDTVICCETLEHVANPLEVVSQMRRVLKPGGWLVLSSPANGFPIHRFPRDYWRILPDTYRDLFCNGMKIASVTHVSGDDHLLNTVCLAQKL